MHDVPYGYCHCGCGEKTKLAPRTHRPKGWTEGEPLKFILGHTGYRRDVPYYEVDPATGCWVWRRYITSEGYGKTSQGRAAHKASYERAKGPVPDGLELDHLCRNRACVNPDHLEAVTALENSHRSLRTKLTDDQVREVVLSPLHRTTVAQRYGISESYVKQLRGCSPRAKRVMASDWP